MSLPGRVSFGRMRVAGPTEPAAPAAAAGGRIIVPQGESGEGGSGGDPLELLEEGEGRKEFP